MTLLFVLFIASAHIRCRSPDEYMGIANKIKKFFHNEGIHSTTIQLEFASGAERKESECALECGKDENSCAAQKCCSVGNDIEMRKRSAVTDMEEGSGENPLLAV